MICSYDCGQEAKYQFKNGKWCCSKSKNSCPYMKKINSNSNKGKFVSEKTKRKISSSIKKLNLKGSNNPNWKGSNGKPLYDTYNSQLVLTDTCKRNDIDKNILEVECSMCKSFFIPSLNSVINRLAAINGTQGGEHKFYCSDGCKSSCSVYRKKHHQEGHPKTEIYNSSEYQEFRKHVLERDNYKCQYCNKKAEHVHHERPQKLEPFFTLDPDLAWSVCKKCHYEKGHTGECSTGALASIIC